ncbi:MAG: RES family NAD+ phosphorylase [Gemmatimonas sp.]
MSGIPDAGMVAVYRIATSAPNYGADDLSGAGAKATGGRWNPVGTPVIYTSRSRALACLETVVHVGSSKPLPLNRYLVELLIPHVQWAARTVFRIPAESPEWDAEPPGHASIDWGTAWLASGTSLVAEVPSVVVPEESNVLLNPGHLEISAVSVWVVRKWMYDSRLALHIRR